MPQVGSKTDSELPISKRDDTSNYVVYAKNSTNKDQTTAITNLLKDLVSDEKNMSVHGSDLGVAFWGVLLTSDDAKKVEADSNVGFPVHLSQSLLYLWSQVSSVIQACTEDCPDPTDS